MHIIAKTAYHTPIKKMLANSTVNAYHSPIKNYTREVMHSNPFLRQQGKVQGCFLS